MVAEMLAKEPDAMKEILRDQPIGRLGEPEEIAAAVLGCAVRSEFRDRPCTGRGWWIHGTLR